MQSRSYKSIGRQLPYADANERDVDVLFVLVFLVSWCNTAVDDDVEDIVELLDLSVVGIENDVNAAAAAAAADDDESCRDDEELLFERAVCCFGDDDEEDGTALDDSAVSPTRAFFTTFIGSVAVAAAAAPPLLLDVLRFGDSSSSSP